jgi:hypothetical protein
LGVRVSPPAPFFPKYENLTAERLFPNDISFGDGVCFAMRLLWCGQDPGGFSKKDMIDFASRTPCPRLFTIMINPPRASFQIPASIELLAANFIE